MYNKNHVGPLIMAKRERKPVYHIQMTDGKCAINNFCRDTTFKMHAYPLCRFAPIC